MEINRKEPGIEAVREARQSVARGEDTHLLRSTASTLAGCEDPVGVNTALQHKESDISVRVNVRIQR